MSLCSDCSSCFDYASRFRGEAYFASGHVTLLSDVQQDTVTAAVRGSERKPYQVLIELGGIDSGEIVAECSCPHYLGGDLCKHIWATLLAIEAQRARREVDAQRLMDASARQLGGSLARRSAVDDCDAEQGDADDRDAVDDVQESTRNVAGDFAGILKDFLRQRQLAASPPPQSRRQPAEWEQQLSRAFAKPALQPPGMRSDWRRAGKGQRQAAYLLNVSSSLQRSGLVIDFFQRVQRKDGDWGKPKRLSLQRSEVDTFNNPEDRLLLRLLLGGEPESDGGYGYRYSPYASSFSRALVPPSMYELLLPRLSASGRLVWLLDSSLPVEEGHTVVWDGGEPWRVRLRVDAADDEHWHLSGELFRADQVRSLSEPVLLLSHGLVLFPDSLARLDAADQFSWIATLRKHPAIKIPDADRPVFLQQIWSAANVPPVELPADLQLEQVHGTPQGKLSIHSPERYSKSAFLYADVIFRYVDSEVSLADPRTALVQPEHGRVVHRDAQTERVLLSTLAELSVDLLPPSPGTTADVQFPVRALCHVVDRLTAEGWQVESEGRLLRRAGAVRLNVVSSVDWFELEGQVDFDGVEVSLPRLLAAVRKKHHYVLLDDGTQGILPDEWLQRFSSLVGLSDPEQDTLRFAPSQALLLDALLAAQDDVQVDDPFDQLRQRLRTFGGIHPSREPASFQGQLREYQREGLGWLDFLRDFRFGGCLADDMGLGKTIQVLALLQSRGLRQLKPGEPRRPSIVVVPKSLVFNWIDEAARFTPELRFVDYTGLGREAILDQLDQYDVLVTTYGTLRRDIVKLKDIRFDYSILDESQAIKNSDSQAAKACRLLHADHRLAMTGTPVENHLGELWSLFEYLNPGMLGRSSTFHSLIKHGQENNGTVKLLSQALRPFLLRRTKEQVLSELPEKTEQTLHCELPGKQRKLYDELREFYRASLAKRVKESGLEQSKIHVLEALLRLRQAACHPGLLDPKRIDEPSAKLDMLLEQLEEIVAEGHKALVFSQFTSLLAIVRRQLDQRKIVYEYLDGRTTKRKDKVQRFQKDAACPVFLISLKAGGHGLNLTAADYVFILDPWWNPAVEAQAIDRAHRLGQQRHVFAYRLICRDTVEDKILELQQSKRELADAIISADNNLIRQLTAEDLQLLLS